jgi:thioredoxin reductase
VQIVGEEWEPRAHRLRDTFARIGIPFGFYAPGSAQGEAIVKRAPKAPEGAPVLAFRNSRTVLTDPSDGTTEEEPADALYVMIGAHPHTDWLDGAVARDANGYLLTGPDLAAPDALGWPLLRPPWLYETSLPGVFAAGDVRHGSVKRVASAVGAGSIAVQLAHLRLAELEA